MHCGRYQRMTRQKLAIALIAISFVCPAAAQSHAPAAAGHPNFEGIWNSATATPLERPAQFKDKAFFTPQEAAAFERQAVSRREDAKPGVAEKTFASYNALFYETATKVLKTLRTSIITDPPDGRIPPLTPAAAAAKSHQMELMRHPYIATDLGLQDQCLVFPTAVAPMTPYIYNSNYQIVQTDHEVMINAEMIHDTRIVRLDGQPHLSPGVRQWLGDSVGHWEGGTLVVDTTNFTDSGGFFGGTGGMLGSDGNLHVVERFSRPDAETILYQFEVDDPTAFTRPWKGEMTLTRSNDRMFEYACHEGNYALVDLLNGTRALDRAESASKKQ
jgi:hypothetical protein